MEKDCREDEEDEDDDPSLGYEGCSWWGVSGELV